MAKYNFLPLFTRHPDMKPRPTVIAQRALSEVSDQTKAGNAGKWWLNRNQWPTIQLSMLAKSPFLCTIHILILPNTLFSLIVHQHLNLPPYRLLCICLDLGGEAIAIPSMASTMPGFLISLMFIVFIYSRLLYYSEVIYIIICWPI